MPQEKLPKQALLAKAKGKRPVGRLRTRWANYIEDLGWNRLGLEPCEMLEVVADRDVRRLILNCCPCNLHGHKRALKEEEDSFIISSIYSFFASNQLAKD